MSRVKQETINKMREVLQELTGETLSKCSLCTETLTHIVMKTAAESGAPVKTVTREIAGMHNEGALENDKVTGRALERRVQRNSDENLKARNGSIKVSGENPKISSLVMESSDSFENTEEDLTTRNGSIKVSEEHKALQVEHEALQERFDALQENFSLLYKKEQELSEELQKLQETHDA